MPDLPLRGSWILTVVKGGAETMKPRIIMVLGMHRSGTSLVTSALQTVGVGLGDSLHPAGPDNPKGFWEDRDCLEINETLLGLMGSAYDLPGFAWTSFPDIPELQKLKTHAIDIVRQKLEENGGVWGFKDPRSCRLISFWKDVFRAHDASVFYVLAIRNPKSVASSLAERNGFLVEKSYILWLQHTIPTIEQTAREKRLVVDYDRFLEQPDKELRRLSVLIGLEISDDQIGNFQRFAAETVDNDLRHSKFSRDDVLSDAGAPALIWPLYELLYQASADEIALDSPGFSKRFKALTKAVAGVAPVLNYMQSLEQDRRELWKRIELSEHSMSGDHAPTNSVDPDDPARLTTSRAALEQVGHHRTGEGRLEADLTEENPLWQELEKDQHAPLMQRYLELEAIAQKDRVEIAQLQSSLGRSREEIEQYMATVALLEEELNQAGTKAEKIAQAEIEALFAKFDFSEKRLHQEKEAVALLRSSIQQYYVQLEKQKAEISRLNVVIDEFSLREDGFKHREEYWRGVEQDWEWQEKYWSRRETEWERSQASWKSQGDAWREQEKAWENKESAWKTRENDLKREIVQILRSHSWKLTSPARFARRLVSSPLRTLRPYFGRFAYAIWRKIPGRPERKTRFKSRLFRAMPFLFRRLRAYQAWLAMEQQVPLTVPVSATARPVAAYDGDSYVPIVHADPPEDLKVRMIAFYLPQFHAIKENDEWWGEGFTEWTNVRPAIPQFDGHHQPHVPDELGYYDLAKDDTMRRQIELAKLYGVGGFCFYYYWFGGTRLLETPIERFLADGTLDLPFCLCWANENWSRRWDGKESELLIAQQHSAADDIEVARDLARHVADPRYIRINGKPLIIVYRPNLLPSAKATSDRWREWFRDNGLGEIYLAYTQSFEVEDPRNYGFDAAIEFPPNNSAPPDITDQIENPLPTFTGTVYDWSIFVKRSEKYRDPGYKIYRSVCPSWDNTARRKGAATIFLNSEPAGYERWLSNAVADTEKNAVTKDERIVFVNAWNEWAEGAHLEPDRRYGYAWLEAGRRAISGEPEGQIRHRIAVISHDAHPHGAQFLALGLVRTLARDLKFDVHTVILGDGRLTKDFADHSTVHTIGAGTDRDGQLRALAKKLKNAGVHQAIVNTTAAGYFVEHLANEGLACVSLVHELPGVIEANDFGPYAEIIAAHASKVVFPAERVAEGFGRFAKVPADRQVIRPQGVWRRNPYRTEKSEIRSAVRAELGASDDAPMVLSVGYGDHRKAPDIFARVGLEVLTTYPDAMFVWIGHWDQTMEQEVAAIIAGHSGSFRFLGYNPDTARYHVAADVYALTSREDPFPNVVLESFDAGVPVIAFAETGGAADLVSTVGGRVVPKEDESAFAATMIELLGDPATAATLGNQASDCVDTRFAFRDYVFDLCDLLGIRLPKVSVVVPNYNYGNYISERLDSIIEQTMPILELIILDDASTDGSLQSIRDWIKSRQFECRVIANATNSGSVFSQWKMGSELAKGDYLWIAEADDLSRPDFLNEVLASIERDDEVALSYCESQQIDTTGRVLTTSYLDYLKDLSGDRWGTHFTVSGRDEVEEYLFVKNTIPNVSAVVFRRTAFKAIFDAHFDLIKQFRIAGDWLTYALVLKSGKISFSPRSANLHRRHERSVVGSNKRGMILDEIGAVQAFIQDEYGLSEQSRARAAHYLERVREELA